MYVQFFIGNIERGQKKYLCKGSPVNDTQCLEM